MQVEMTLNGIGGVWDIKNYLINYNYIHKIVKYSVFKRKYKDKVNPAGEYVKKLAYNLTYNYVVIEIPPGKLSYRR